MSRKWLVSENWQVTNLMVGKKILFNSMVGKKKKNTIPSAGLYNYQAMYTGQISIKQIRH